MQLLISLLSFAFLAVPGWALAHEQYVLEPSVFETAYQAPYLSLWSSLADSGNLLLVVTLTVLALLAIVPSFIFWRSNKGQSLDHKLIEHEPMVFRLLMFMIGAVFLAVINYRYLLGPELTIGQLPTLIPIIWIAMFIGLFLWLDQQRRIVAVVGLSLYLIMLIYYGQPALYYLEYPLFFSSLLVANQSQRTFLNRIGLGLALLAGAIFIKLLHPAVLLAVVEEYQLTQYQYFFPADPHLVVVGATLAELGLALALLLGFQVRLVSAILLFYLTLSVSFFKEAVIPHLPLFGLAIYLFITGPGRCNLDDWLAGMVRLKGKGKSA